MVSLKTQDCTFMKYFSPGYAKMWVHSSLKQYIQARPWLLSLLSLNLLRPEYYPFPLIHIPGGACPYAEPENVKNKCTNIKGHPGERLCYFNTSSCKKRGHGLLWVCAHFRKWLYCEKDPFPRWQCSHFGLSSLLVSSSVYSQFFAVFIVMWKLKSRVEARYSADLEKSRKFSIAKKENQSESSIASWKSLVLVSEGERQRKILKIGLFTATLRTRKSWWNRRKCLRRT